MKKILRCAIPFLFASLPFQGMEAQTAVGNQLFDGRAALGVGAEEVIDLTERNDDRDARGKA